MGDPSLFQEVGKVLPYLCFGPRVVSESEATLRDLGITHVFSVVGPPTVSFPGIAYDYVNDIHDRDGQPILEVVLHADEFITQARRENGVVFVLCMAGISRSATVVIGHLMLGMGMSFEEALEMVQFDRPIADPNAGFRSQLRLLEQIRNRTQERMREWEEMEEGEEEEEE